MIERDSSARVCAVELKIAWSATSEQFEEGRKGSDDGGEGLHHPVVTFLHNVRRLTKMAQDCFFSKHPLAVLQNRL